MRIKHLTLIILFIIYGCKPNKEVELILLNNELGYSNIFDTPKDTSDSELFNNTVYPRYKNNNDWVKSLNNVKFELRNNTNDKLFVISEKFIFTRVYEITQKNQSGIFFQITNNANEDLPVIPLSMHYNSGPVTQEQVEQYKKDSIATENTIYKTYEDEKRLNNFKVLNPNESILISTKLSLPIPINYENVLDFNFGIPMYKGNVYKFKLHYVLNKKDIEDNLPKQLLDSLKQKGVVIKDILLSSKEIEVIPN